MCMSSAGNLKPSVGLYLTAASRSTKWRALSPTHAPLGTDQTRAAALHLFPSHYIMNWQWTSWLGHFTPEYATNVILALLFRKFRVCLFCMCENLIPAVLVVGVASIVALTEHFWCSHWASQCGFRVLGLTLSLRNPRSHSCCPPIASFFPFFIQPRECQSLVTCHVWWVDRLQTAKATEGGWGRKQKIWLYDRTVNW